jgi:CheY-like chemotaxis protein
MEAIGRLAGGISHDFNNLLTVIIGYSEELLNRIPDPVLRQGIEAISEAGKRAAELTRKLLTFSKNQILVPQVVDLNAVLSGMQQILRRLLREDIEIRFRLDPQLCPIKADPVQLERVVLNLAINSREAMPSGGELVLETHNVVITNSEQNAELRHGRYAMLTIKDTGCGMDAETRTRIFEPFFTTKSEGTGLGLATVYGIVMQSGGIISVSSEIGAGTTFKVHFPQAAAVPDAAPARAGTGLPPAGTGTVLVVEDEEQIRLYVESVLKASGYKVLGAGGAEEAVKIASEFNGKIDLVLTDVVMPGFNGAELFARLSRLLPDLKVLYMSGYADHAVVQRNVIENGAAFLQKPFTPQVLAEKIREVLGFAA